ncbi:alkaline phosphatase [Marinicauda pacifica]|jgi:alkaline phosphatase|uniref:Alkaline phosphatase n=2 Tax=Marinicauda pacifica TaxID=1133559 RepID=A0A4S2HDA0_9PROT|nr:alkaline phosphatase [Marinicauda pacifica]TGY94020.1 alkaline phosphatase [Marinicauda pacifica]
MTIRSLLLAASVFSLGACASNTAQTPPAAYGPAGPDAVAAYEAVTYSGTGAQWRNLGQQELAERINQPLANGRARNVIVFIADGMSLGTVTAARIYDGQSRGMSGEENYLPFERWGHTATIKTYSENGQVPDSAATASAIHTGVKTHNGAISVYARQTLESCRSDADLPATLLELAEARGLSTGIVSSARLTHATPATAFAHVPSRNWEVDAVLPADAVEAGCRDIARQLVEFDHGNGLELAIGGGRAAFLPSSTGGQRADGRDLTAEWVERGGAYADNRADLLASPADRPLLGLLASSHLPYELDRGEDEASLAELTELAVNRLQGDEDGFYLLVEAGRVDHAHHGSNAARALADAQEFAQAIERASEMVDLSETLIIVTADHGHVFSIAGYPRRGNPILGLVHPDAPDLSDDPTPPATAQDGRPYTTLGYYTGPHQRPPEGSLTDAEVMDPDYRQESAVPMGSETHSGEDVIAYATGPQAHLVRGVMEQNTLFHIITYAYGWDQADED